MQADKSTEHTEAWDKIRSAHGILVPGGFGIRGVEGMILAAKYAREKEVPYLGICLGMQVGAHFSAACMPTRAGIVIQCPAPMALRMLYPGRVAQRLGIYSEAASSTSLPDAGCCD